MKIPLIIISTVITLSLVAVGVNYLVHDKIYPAEALPSVTPQEEQPAPAEKPASAETPIPAEEPAPDEKNTQAIGSSPGFEQKIESLIEAITDTCATGEPKEVTLVFTEEEANAKAAELLTAIEMPQDIPLEVEDVCVDFQPDNNALVEVKSIIYGTFRANIKSMVRVSIEEGKPRVEITKVSFGFIPLPQLLKDKVVSLVTQKTNNLLSQLTEMETGSGGKIELEFTNIDIQGDKATVTVIVTSTT